jgi:ABC-type polysaccharide/polyol phosphate export permease
MWLGYRPEREKEREADLRSKDGSLMQTDLDPARRPAAKGPLGHPGPLKRDETFLEASRRIAADVVDYRHLLFQLTLRDIRVRYKQSVMGFGWAIFMPVLIILSGVLVRYAMAYLSGSELETEDVAGLAVKSIPWAFFVGAIQSSSQSLTGNLNLVTKIYFPRAVLPLAGVLAQAFDTSLGTLTLGLALPLLLGVAPHLAILWVLPLALALVLFATGCALLLSSANVFFRDVKYIVQVLLTFGIFFTPVFFEPEMFGEIGARLMMLNPVAPILEGLRLSVVEGHNLLVPVHVTSVEGIRILTWSPWYLSYVAVWALVFPTLSAHFFHRLEFMFAEYV